MRSLLIVLALGFISLFGYTQEVSISGKIARGDIFENEKELSEWVNLCGKDTIILFKQLTNSMIDSLQEDKLINSLSTLRGFLSKPSSNAVKSEIVNFILVTTKSKHSSVVAKSFRILKDIPVKNFDKSAVDSIVSMISKYPRIYIDAMLLVGYINTPNFIDEIKVVFPNSRRFTRQEQWTTYKVLARLGDKEALTFCINKVTALPINDQVIDVLYADLIYTRQKEAVDVLVKTLNSDEPLCSSTNPNNDSKMICGYRIMEMLAPVIEDFPVKTLPSGDLDVKDYKKALIEVRNWFKKRESAYSIKKQ